MLSRVIYISLAWLLLAAHFSRADSNILMILSLLVPFLLLIKNKWTHLLVVSLTILGSIEWVLTAFNLIRIRISLEEPWARMALIIFVVAAFTLFSAIFLYSKKIRAKYQ